MIVVTFNEHRLRIIHHNGSVGTLAGGGEIGENAGAYKDSDDLLAARFKKPAGASEGGGFQPVA